MAAADLESLKSYLRSYDGPDMNIMEVCGSHTAAIAKNGIPSLLSPRLHLLSGPGCPVCVTASAYIDRLVELSLTAHTCVVSFGDLIRVPGSRESLSAARGRGARVKMVYSPMEILPLAAAEPETLFIFAAVGFETTAPVYALLMQELCTRHVRNVKLLTALKKMPPVIRYLCADGAPVDGFLAPGHVCAVTGYRAYEPIAEQYGLPFVVSGFTGPELLLSLSLLVHNRGLGTVANAYPRVVKREGNPAALSLTDRYFAPAPAYWRGLGMIPDSGLLLRDSCRAFDAGSAGLTQDEKLNAGCCCDKVLTGRMRPYACPLFGSLCTPQTPQGACMVSQEGSCFSYLTSGRRDN